MDGNWEVYPAELEGELALFFLDFGVVEEAPVEGLPYSTRVTLTLSEMRENGIPTEAEMGRIREAELTLEPGLRKRASVRYVGRCITAGRAELYFYGPKTARLQNHLDELLEGTDYRGAWTSEFKKDDDWSIYLDFLYPSERAVQQIENRHVCRLLLDNGDPLTAARRVDHWVRFNRETSGRHFLGLVAELGFTVEGEDEDAGLFGPDERGKFFTRFWREDTPAADAIDGLVLPLFDLAAENHGRYEGWESIVLSSDEGADS